jgi:hypothetical protein
MKRICRLFAVVGILALAAGPATWSGRVNEICVVGGEIEYCAPQTLN